MAAYQYIYVMKDRSKSFPGRQGGLKDIWLSFLPGAKIGVLGPNGAGKSTLMKIMAGMDQDFDGEAWAAEGVSVGYLSQEPQLDPTRTPGKHHGGLDGTKALLDRFDAVSKLRRPRRRNGRADRRAGRAAGEDRRPTPGNSSARSRSRWTRCAARRAKPPSPTVRRRAAPRGAVPAAALEPDLLLLDEPTNHLDAESVAWLEHSWKIRRHRRGGDPRPYFLDNVAGWILELDRGRASLRGQLLLLAGQKRKRLEQEKRGGRQKTLARELEWIGQARGPPSQEQGAYPAYERC